MPKRMAVAGTSPGGLSAAFFMKFYGENWFEITLMERLGTEKFRKYHRMCDEAISRRVFRMIEPIRPPWYS